MPRLWPQQIPLYVRQNPLRSAEVRVFEKLHDDLSDEWTVFYSRPWTGLTSQGEEIDGEADFVVAHPDRGILTIEVKGGKIDFDPVTDQWTSTDRHGVIHNIKNPIGQAKSSKHEIVKRLRASPHWKSRWIHARHGVLFPDSEVPNRDLGMDELRFVFCDWREFENDLTTWILNRLTNAPDEDDEPGDAASFGLDGIRALEKLLAEPIHLRTPLGRFLLDDDRALKLLTREQYYLLDVMEDQKRVLIRGGAGTGKTVLASESAIRRAGEGQDVLFLCFNRGLALDRQSALSESGVTVRTFHGLCRDLVNEAGLAIPRVDERSLYDTVLPDLLVQAIDALPDRRFDAVIVDEAHDFRSHWWVAVDMLLKNDEARLQVFFDSNQRLYEIAEGLAGDLAAQPWRLPRNLRNTDQIHEATMRFYDGVPVLPSRVIGRPIEFENVNTNDVDSLAGKISRRVKRLVEVEGVPSDEIAILAASTETIDQLEAHPGLANFGFRRCDERGETGPVMDTVRRYKGLEAWVVIVIANPQLMGRPELPYVALSRARTLLIIYGYEDALARLGQKSAK